MSQALVALFAPYCQGLTRGHHLELALDLLATGELVGERRLRPQGSRPFAMRWQAAASPLEAAQVNLRLADGSGEPVADYSFALPTHRLVLWLMDGLAAADGAAGVADLPDSFWFWLILGLEPEAQAP